MNRQERMYKIVGRLSHPSIPEIQSFIKLHFGDHVCLGLQDLSYQNILYYLMRLEDMGKILSLSCSSGYRKRFCLNFGERELRNRLHPLVRYRGKTSSYYLYSLGKRRIKIKMPATNDNEQDENDIDVLIDTRLERFYITCNTLLVGVIELDDMEHPRLPGPTYGLGTEYERCLKLLEKLGTVRKTLGVKGERRLTG